MRVVVYGRCLVHTCGGQRSVAYVTRQGKAKARGELHRVSGVSHQARTETTPQTPPFLLWWRAGQHSQHRRTSSSGLDGRSVLRRRAVRAAWRIGSCNDCIDGPAHSDGLGGRGWTTASRTVAQRWEGTVVYKDLFVLGCPFSAPHTSHLSHCKVKMRVFSFTAGVLSLAASTLVLCQTPPGTNPSTSKNVAVKYGSTVVTPNLLLPEAREPHSVSVSCVSWNLIDHSRCKQANRLAEHDSSRNPYDHACRPFHPAY